MRPFTCSLARSSSSAPTGTVRSDSSSVAMTSHASATLSSRVPTYIATVPWSANWAE